MSEEKKLSDEEILTEEGKTDMEQGAERDSGTCESPEAGAEKEAGDGKEAKASGDARSGGEAKDGGDAEDAGEAKDGGDARTGGEIKSGGEAAEEDAGETPEGDPEDRKGGIFSRKDKKALQKKDEEIAQLKDRYMRTLAEYENFRKRTEKEKSDLYAYAVKDVMTKILPVLDNLERGLVSLPEESREDPVAQGMDKIAKEFVKALDDIGVKPIEAEGESFDPNLHNAVMHVEDESLGENVVAEELQKGYTYKDSVIRYSMVKVAN